MEKRPPSSPPPPEPVEDVCTGLKGDSEDPASPKDEGSPMKSYGRVFTYNDATGWVTGAIAFSCMIAAGVLLPLMNLIFGKFVTVFNKFVTGQRTPEEFRSDINQYTLYFVYLFVAKLVLSYIWTTIVSINAIRVSRAIRTHFLKQTLRQEIVYFDSSESGSISGSINKDGNLVNQGVSEKFGLTVQATSTFVSAFVVAFVVQWKLTLITMTIIPAILIVISVCVGIDNGIEGKLTARWGEADKLAEEVFSSIRNVHAFWAYPKMSRKFMAIMEDAKTLGQKKPPVYALMFCIQFFCIYSGYGLAFWQGIRMYHRGEVSEPGDVVTVILAVLLAAQGLTQIAPQAMAIAKAAAAAHSLFKRIDRESQIDSLSTSGYRPSKCHGNITFDNVTFAYPSRPDLQVLWDLDLNIPANKTTAIVGASGSGKSTIVSLLERWFSPNSGKIILDGHMIGDINIQWLRTNIRLVQQEPVMFNATILENVAHGLFSTSKAGLSEEEKYALVQDACKAAYAHEFIKELPEGYHTRIGERGATLSGGQKQRLAIARSVISDPRVLLLDEATSALDANSERIVQQALNNVAVGRTMVVIAHRLSTIREADNIVVMSKGTIIEQGTHDELIYLGGAYSKLVLAQSLGEHGKGIAQQEFVSEAANKGMSEAKTTSTTDQQRGVSKAIHGTALNRHFLKCLFIIFKEQRRLWVHFGVVVAAATLAGATNPALAVLFSRVMDTFSLSADAMLNHANFYALMFLVVALGNLFTYSILGWMSAIVSQEIMRSYRFDIFNNVMQQNMTFFDDPDNTTGALVSRLSTEPSALQDLLSSNVALMLTILVSLVSSCMLAIAYGWKLGLVLTFGALPPLVAAGYVRMRLEIKLDNDTALRFANSAGIASEAVMAIRTIASLSLEKEILAKYEESLRLIAQASVGSLVKTMFLYSLSQSMSFLAMALGFWYGGRLMSFGDYSAKQFYTVFIAVIFSGEAAANLFTYTSSISAAQGAANYVFHLRRQVPLDTNDARFRGGDDGSSDTNAVAVECKELGFSYQRRPGIKVLKDVSLTVQPGQFVAFVGPSGCGKTTMISLLERFYEPTRGIICFDGVDSRSIGLRDYRRQIALVQQEPVLYQGSLRENIAMGVEDASGGVAALVSDADIMEACRQANIDSFIDSLPEGLSTPCGNMGVQFSGGQRQRIAIARALIRNSKLLLLDEATSSLDSESERIVQTTLDAAATGESSQGNRARTTVAVAHRLSTIKGADVIFVFSNGRIVEMGNHSELVEKQGIYYQMCMCQSLD